MKSVKLWLACALLAAGAPAVVAQTRTGWALDAQDRIFRSSAGQWTEMPGLLRQVSVSNDNNVWGVAGNQTIWRWNGQGWDNMPGLLTRIAVGAKGHVWGVSAGDQIWRWNENVNNWDLMTGLAWRVSVASDGAVWVINRGGAAYRWAGDDWVFVVRDTLEVAAGSVNNVWRIDNTNSIWRYNPAKTPDPWDLIPGKLKQISVSADGEVWGIDLNNALVRRNGENWEPLQRTFSQASVGPLGAAAPSGGTLPTGKAEEDNALISYSGPWGRLPDNAASGGSYMVASQTGATLTAKFTGDTIAIYRRLDTDGGIFNIRVDNKDCGNFSSYFSERRWQVPAVVHGLGVGEHTLVLTIMADRPTGSSGTNTYIDALETPGPVTPTTSQQKGIDRLNQVRTQLGLPPARLVPALNLAAQSHAEYIQRNPGSGHSQTPGTAGFIGTDPSDRVSYFGYGGVASENIWGGADAGRMVDATLNSVYHRIPVVQYDATEIGFGTNTEPWNVMKAGFKSRPQPPASRYIYTYPSDGQTGVAEVRWDINEGPNPLPDKPRPFGTLISLHIKQPANAPQGTDTTPVTGSLQADGGANVPVYILTPQNDANRHLSAGNYFIVPQAPLAFGTTYTAKLSGADQNMNPFTKEWKFSTIAASALTSYRGEVDGGGFTFNWAPAGEVVSTKLSWGKTQALGTDVAGQARTVFEGEPPVYRVTLPNLDAGTYYYQITATDAKGNTTTTPVTAFVMPAVAISFVRINSYNFDTGAVSVNFGTTKPIVSAEMEWGPTTAYGSKEPARASSRTPGDYFATLVKLPLGTYNFKLVAKDAAGAVVATSPNQTFTVTR